MKLLKIALALVLLNGAAAGAEPRGTPKSHRLFLIQTGAFKSEFRAREHCNPLAAGGFPLHVVKTTGANESNWFLCRSIDAYEREHANEIISALKTDARLEDVIIVRSSSGAEKPNTSRAPIPQHLRTEFERFMSQRNAATVEVFEDFVREQARRH